MLFNSIDFIVFLVIVTAITFRLPHRFRWPFLLVASYVFYGWWNASYLVLIVLSSLVDFVLARAIFRTPERSRRLRLLLVSLSLNLGLLFTFKYWNFAAESATVLAHWFGLAVAAPGLSVLLPPGISFYTFQSLSYTIDIYREEYEPEDHLGRFLLYVAFFPQLVAGPIERAGHLLPQFRIEKTFDWNRLASGSQLILWGLFQKVVIADRLALYVDAVYNHPSEHNASSFLLATYAFAFQIYCDFAGYSDIAIGAARIFDFDLMRNFDRPYFSRSITEFWRRWHLSLSTWLRDYLYIPLGGNRGSQLFTYRNLLITMLLGGLWHGASWNFVIWGALQGVMLSASRLTLPTRDRWNDALGVPHWLRSGLRVWVTFHLVCLSWVFFRANTLADASMLLGSLTRDWGRPYIDASSLLHGLLGVAVLLAVHLRRELQGSVAPWLSRAPTPSRWVLWYAMLFAIMLFGVDGDSQFIYFQF